MIVLNMYPANEQEIEDEAWLEYAIIGCPQNWVAENRGLSVMGFHVHKTY